LFVLSRPFAGRELLTALRQQIVLAQFVPDVRSKEATCSLDVSSRMIEFHRANTMQKLAVENAVDLAPIVVGNSSATKPRMMVRWRFGYRL
jgi:FixJ family two-component response regulator